MKPHFGQSDTKINELANVGVTSPASVGYLSGEPMEKGQAAYEQDLLKRPFYHDLTPRKPWEFLSKVAKQSWEYGYVDLEVKCGSCGEISVHHMTPSEADRATGATCGYCGRSGKFDR